MGDLGEFSLPLRAFLKTYRWRRIDPVPWSPLREPLAKANVAIVTTAGFVLPDQPPFDEHVKGGDNSFRVIPADADVRTLIDMQRSEAFDHGGVAADANLAFPLDRLHKLARDGAIGRVNRRHLSFMGSLTATARLVKERAPAAARLLVEDGVDAVLLVPV